MAKHANRTKAKVIKELADTSSESVADLQSAKGLQLRPDLKPVTTCPRCKGDGFWHSTKTGYRAKTTSEPLIDKKRKCPECCKEKEQS